MLNVWHKLYQRVGNDVFCPRKDMYDEIKINLGSSPNGMKYSIDDVNVSLTLRLAYGNKNIDR